MANPALDNQATAALAPPEASPASSLASTTVLPGTGARLVLRSNASSWGAVPRKNTT